MVNQGYKQTEIGIIPEDWEICVAKDLYLKARIGWQGLKKDEYLDEGDYYLVTGTDFLDNKISWKNCHYVLQERYEQDKNIQLSPGDILITKDGSIGKTAFVDTLDRPATLNSGIFLVRPKNDKINQAYLYFIFKSEYFNKFLKDLTAGSTIVHLYQKDFVSFKYPLPNRKEQELIAKSIIDINSMISSLEKLIEKYKSIKSTCLQQMFPQKGETTPKMRLPGFTGAWEQRKLSEVATMHARIGWQNLRTSEFLDSGDYMLITGTDFNDGAINYSTCHFVERERYEQDKHIQIKNGSILITKDGTLGKVAYVQGLSMPATLNAGVFNVEIIDETEVDNKYLFQYLKAPFLMDYVDKKATGGTIKHLNQNILVDFPVLLPSKAEQKAIGVYFERLDNLITLHQRKLNKTKKIKQGMMQQLLTRKIRLV